MRYVLQHKGKDAAFAGALEKPPVSTRQVMEPETYLKGETVEPLKIPDLDKLVGPNYERYDFGGMGEFDVYLLAKQYAPDKDPKDFYANWRGGYYLAVHAKGAPKDQIALLYVSRWDSPEAAQEFAAMYEKYVPNRYPRWSKEVSAPYAAEDRRHLQVVGRSGVRTRPSLTEWQRPADPRRLRSNAQPQRLSAALLQAGSREDSKSTYPPSTPAPN